VVLRFIDRNISDKLIAQNVRNVENNGFVNYYGMQRFGTQTVRSFEGGKELMKGNYKKLIKLFLSQYPDHDFA
jgi:tRNA pseudouridine13 synthase